MARQLATIRRRQTTAALAQGLLSLPGSKVRGVSADLVSPYFQTTDPRKEAPGRDISLALNLMKAIIGPLYNFDNGDGYAGTVDIKFFNESNDTPTELWHKDIPLVNAHSGADLSAFVADAILSHSVDQSYGMSASDIDFGSLVSSLSTIVVNSPQAAIADSTADVSDVSTQLNTLLAELRTLGLIAS